jgi:putative glycerol-1-phosphate prenyltransferase
MKNIYKTIIINREVNRKMLAVLLDPDKCRGSILASTIAVLKSHTPDFVFVGGSHMLTSVDSLIELLEDELDSKIVLFPGNAAQFSAKADALLYLSLLSGRNAEFLIGQHITSAIAIKNSGMEVIPTGYLLIDGGKPSSVEYISNTRTIPRDKNEIALSTAVAAELLGMRLVYLEAGSGADVPVPVEMINYVSRGLSLPLVVGGGIKTTEQMVAAYDAGADIVVVGNVFETNSALISDFVSCSKNYTTNQYPEFLSFE